VMLYLQAGDCKFSAHRVVLAACMPYFHSMFTLDMVESRQDEITVVGVAPRCVILFLSKKLESVRLLVYLVIY